jgi:hypothetical protein
MKEITRISVVFGLTLLFALFVANTSVLAQQGNGGKPDNKGFVDLNGDGINDNAIDSDGDGIPNGQDPDYVRPQDGSGNKMMRGNSYRSKFNKSIKNNFGSQNGNGYGPGDGTGNNGVGPKDGTGYGPGNGSGTGDCDGTGPKGTRGGRG